MENGNNSSRVVRFGVFEADLRTGELRERGRKVRLQEKPFQTLALLVEKAGNVVTREELRERLWPADTFVEFDANLNTAIKRLREALGDSAERPRYIETLPKRGYRFIVPVARPNGIEAAVQRLQDIQPMPSQTGLPSHRWILLFVAGFLVAVLGVGVWAFLKRLRPALTTTAARPMLAVLPFRNLSGNPAEDYVSDGMTEEMITQLGRMDPQGLGVIARTSVMKYKNTDEDTRQIGGELNVDFVLEGSVREDSKQVFITAQLIQVRNRTDLWSETYERPLRDIFAIQRDVARRVAESLALRLLPETESALARAETVNTDAYEAYLKGRFAWDQSTLDGFRRALDAFDEAIRFDPNYALAYDGVARTNLSLIDYRFISLGDGNERATQAVEKAIALDPSIPESYVLRAAILSRSNPRRPGIEDAYRRALALNPSDAEAHEQYGLFLRDAGRFNDALRQMHEAVVLNPLSPREHMLAGWVMLDAGRDEESSSEFQKTLGIVPNYPPGLYFMALVKERHNQWADAVALLEKSVESSGRTPKYLHALGMAYAKTGRREQALKILDELRDQAKGGYVEPGFITSLEIQLRTLKPSPSAAAALDPSLRPAGRRGWALRR
ncbi:MAG TPA: winged helix-turn-helix domain-containing protein [Terriglobia bacterium]|nr:winged helix-turn-helix domain-containing protein [Terriglobia bacterium]